MKRRDCGSILPALLPLLFMAAGLSLLTFSYEAHVYLLARSEIRRAASKERNLSELLEQLGAPPVRTDGKISCYGDESVICLRSSRFIELPPASNVSALALSDTTLFPDIDFNSLFAAPAQCADQRAHFAQATSFGTALTGNSSIWPVTCNLTGTLPAGYFVYLANLEASDPLRPVPASGPALVSTPGYIDLPQGIMVSGDTLITAAGDINIGRITATAPSSVTITSTTGLVNISGISGALQLRIISRYGHFVHGAATTQTSELLPPLQNESCLQINLSS